jgi:transketolase
MKPRRLDERSKHLRRVIVRVLQKARRGHVGAAYSLIEILRVLYDDILRFNPHHPKWQDRDRCILSKGHGCLALYAILADKGFFPDAELDRFCTAEGILGGHPDAGKVPGVEASTGALGHGLPIGLGMALHLRIAKSPGRVFVILGDGECNEGSVWEAALFAPMHRLDNLMAIIDFNKWQATGRSTEVLSLAPLGAKWAAFGWSTYEVDGHNVSELVETLQRLPDGSGKPVAIVAHTVKGKGVSFMEDDNNWHYRIPTADEVLAGKRELGTLKA